MAVKVLLTHIGQQLISDVKQIENKDTNQIVGYWLKQPRTINYNQGENGELGVNFGPVCPVSDEAEFSVRAEYIVAILEPREDVAEGYNTAVYPPVAPQTGLETISTEEVAAQATPIEPPTVPVNDEPSTDIPQNGTNPGLTQ